MRVLPLVLFLSFSEIFFFTQAYGGVQQHLILKNDFNNDGIADRVVFASHGISGFYQATQSNNKVDTFFLQQGNKSVSFISSKALGGPYIKLVETAGIFTTVTLAKYQNKKFKIITSAVITNKKFFSDDPFACPNADPFGTQTKKTFLPFSEAIKKFSVETTIKKSIGKECKAIFGKEYQKLESQILSACSVSDGKPEKNDLVSCLDKDQQTRLLGGKYKTALAENIFEDGFKISCAKSDKSIPLASFDPASKNISIFQTKPESQNRNFKADFFHDMLHGTGVSSDKVIEGLVKDCLSNTGHEDRVRIPPQTELGFQAEQEKLKDGIRITLPTQDVEPTSVASAITESSKALDSDFSMGNNVQYQSLSNLSKNVIKSFEPIMNAAYSAAVPKVFASEALKSGPYTNAASIGNSSIEPLAANKAYTTSGRTKSAQTDTNDKMPEISTVPSAILDKHAVEDSPDKELSKSHTPSKERNIASLNETANSSASSAQTAQGFQTTSDSGQNFATPTDARSQALSKNVRQIGEEEDFLKSLTTGKYTEVKARLLDPKNERIMVEKRIQYLNRGKPIGSKQPMIILKDLGNGFSVQRVLTE